MLTRVPVGLCAECAYSRTIVSAKGSQFTLCDYSRVDAQFPKYPRLPVLQCAGYEPIPPSMP